MTRRRSRSTSPTIHGATAITQMPAQAAWDLEPEARAPARVAWVRVPVAPAAWEWAQALEPVVQELAWVLAAQGAEVAPGLAAQAEEGEGSFCVQFGLRA